MAVNINSLLRRIMKLDIEEENWKWLAIPNFQFLLALSVFFSLNA